MKKAITRIKGILLALMYAVLYPVIEFVVYRVFILWHHINGKLSSAEIAKSASKNSYALSIVISLVALLIYWGICRLRKKKIPEYIHTKKAPLMIFIMAAIIAIGTRLIVEVYCTFIQNLDVFKKSIIESATVAPRLSTRLDFAIAFFSILIVAPIFEEILFRGLIMGEFKKVMRPWLAILLQAIIFGLSHGAIFQVPYTIFIGLLLGIIYYRTNNIIAPIVCHLVYNYSATLMLSEFSRSGAVVFVAVALMIMSLSMFYIFANTQIERKN